MFLIIQIEMDHGLLYNTRGVMSIYIGFYDKIIDGIHYLV